jgi:hypothetical protein
MICNFREEKICKQGDLGANRKMPVELLNKLGIEAHFWPTN